MDKMNIIKTQKNKTYMYEKYICNAKFNIHGSVHRSITQYK